MKTLYIALSLACLFLAHCSDSKSNSNTGSTKNENSIHVIFPYNIKGVWLFDDESKNIEREPFVTGVPAIIDELVSNTPNAEKGFRLTFSAIAFPGHQMTATREKEENGGCWYTIVNTSHRGWLCPAMFKYFDEAPEKIYLKSDPIP
ncbi:DUF6717 family protein [Rubritalea sp.]|uniref:DUF6717 family protein n=1 Tax=Rubritalea sp. TaxID=2109375 RepID=UPI003EF27C76